MSSATPTPATIGTGRHATVIKPGLECDSGTPIPGTISKIYSKEHATAERRGANIIAEGDPHGMATISPTNITYCETLPASITADHTDTDTITTMPDAGTPLIQKHPGDNFPQFIVMPPYFQERRRPASKEVTFRNLHFASRELFRIVFTLLLLNHHGIYHRDIHPGNILAKDAGDDGYRLTIIDYEDAEKTGAKEEIGDAQIFISVMNRDLESVFGSGIPYSAENKLWELLEILNRARVNPITGLKELHAFSAKYGAKEDIGEFMGELMTVGTDGEPDAEHIRQYVERQRELTS